LAVGPFADMMACKALRGDFRFACGSTCRRKRMRAIAN